MTYIHTGGGQTERDGAAILLLHGAGMDHTVWRFQTRWLAHRGWQVMAPDLPGHGSSDGPPLDSIAAMADWVAELVSGRPVAVLGHSMGSLTAIDLAARHADAVERIVLVGSAMQMSVHPGLQQAAENDLPRAARLISTWSFRRAFPGGHPQPGAWQPGETTRLLERSQPGVLATDLTACAEYDARDTASQLEVPIMVVAGTDDRMVPPAGAHRLAEIMPRAEFVSLPECGHEPMIQNPTVFNTMLGRWLRAERTVDG